MPVLYISYMSANDTSRIVIYDSRVTLQIVVSLTDNSRGIFCYHNIFKVQATEGDSWVGSWPY